MVYPVPPTTSRFSTGWQRAATAFALVLIVLIGVYFRTVNLADWDGNTGHHPDERFMHFTVVGLRVPQSWGEYFTVDCPTPVPNPRNPDSPQQDWEPSETSGCSTLNPRNFSWSRGYVYGTLPTTIARLTAEWTDRTDVEEIQITGRALSMACDIITLLALFALATLLFDRRVGLLAAALYAGAVMPIQQSHFFTVDHFAVCFGALALLFIVRLARSARWYDALLAGLFIAASVASKINMAALVGLVFVAVAQIAWRNFSRLRAQRRDQDGSPLRVDRLAALLIGPLALLTLTGVVCLVAFRVFQPDAFAGPSFWNIRPNQRFVAALQQARLTANGTIDLPSSIQWADRSPWLFPLQNMVLWGMGAPLGIVAWLAWAIGGWQIVVRRRAVALIPWLWVGFYFAWQGQQFVTTMRYFLPIYPPLIMFAAWLLIGDQRPVISRRRSALRGPWAIIRGRSTVILIAVLAATWSWAWAYTRIYTRPYTRVVARDWLEREAPQGARTTWEYWDDLLPFEYNSNYTQITTYPYGEEEPVKYSGNLQPGDQDGDQGLIAQLAQADYVVLASPRVYGSIVRMPQRYPVTLRYYRALFDGSLGYELAADIRSEPSLFGIPISDLGADEAFWVYDHPPVLIFRRTEQFSPDRARLLLTQDMAWDEVYRGLLPVQLNRTPSALRLTASAWDKLRSIDTGYLFGGIGLALGALLWLVTLEVFGWATWGWLRRLRLPLADEGWALSRALALLLLAIVPALIGATQRVAIGRWLVAAWAALLLIAGLWRLWRDRGEIPAWLRAHRRWLLTGYGLYGGSLLLGAVLAATIAATPESAGRWVALVRSATFPPYDPGFVGGHDTLAYAAQLPFALFDRLLGIEPLAALTLALPTALALAVLGLWSALGGTRRDALSIAGTLLILVAGVAFGGGQIASLWSALADHHIGALGLLAFAATALGLGAGLRGGGRIERGAIGLAALLTLTLIVVRGASGWALLAVWAAVAARNWAGMRGDWRRWAWLLIPPLLIALVIGQAFAWSVTAGSAASTLESGPLLAAIGLPLLILVLYTIVVAPALAERPLLIIMGVVIVGWTVFCVALRLSITLLMVPWLMGWVWLAVLALLPGSTRRLRAGSIMVSAAAAALLILAAGLALGDRLAADAPALLVLATLLLAFAAGQALSLLAYVLSRRTRAVVRPLAMIGLVLLVFAAGISGGLATRRPAGESAAALREAARWLGANGESGQVIATAPDPSIVASYAGLPTLIEQPDEQRRLRAAVMPAVGGVIEGRLRALDAIYGGDVQRAAALIRSYHVDYVLLGPDERARWGDGAGAALDGLSRSTQLELAYDRDGVQIYRASAASGLPPFVTDDGGLTPPAASKTLRLDRPVGELPVVGEYAWNQLATENQLIGVLLWLALLEGLGLVAFPVAALVFRRWHDRGWGASKLIGLLIWGYAVWLPVSLGWYAFTWRALLAGALALAALALVCRSMARGTATDAPPMPWGAILRSELCFLVSFGLWTWLRAANPDLWHPFFGGERPFEFGLLNALIRTPVFPPYDPFFSGGVVNYYYYGLFLLALPIRATGIDPAIGFNLAYATVLALTATAALWLGRELTGRWRYGLAAIGLLLAIGPIASVIVTPHSEAQGIGVVLRALGAGLSGLGDRLGWWFWGPSRVVPFTINEFPLFGFIYGDLHPHLIALPFTLLAIGCAATLLRPGPLNRAALVLSALLLGMLAVANSWDAPTYALLIGGALIGRAWRGSPEIVRGRLSWRVAGRVLLAIGLALTATLAGVALYAPFFASYGAQVRGIGVVRGTETVQQYALLYGPQLFLLLSLFGAIVWSIVRVADRQRRIVARLAVALIPVVIGVLLLTGAAPDQEPTLHVSWALRIVLALLGGSGIVLALLPWSARRLREAQWLVLWMMTVGLLVALGVQVVFIRDHLNGSNYERMNTVFKFGVQLWTLWSIGGAAALPLVLRSLRRSEWALGAWTAVLLLLVLLGLSYPLAAIPSRLAMRFDRTQPLTLDGLAFMDQGRFNFDDTSVALGPDAEAIRWLKANVPGTPVVATSSAEFYRHYGPRIAANTGLPTLVDATHQAEQRPPAEVTQRERDAKELFSSTDPQRVAQLLAQLEIGYVYVGPIERAQYDTGVATFDQLLGAGLELAYQNDGVRIYRVNRDALQVAGTPVVPPAVVTDPQLEALKAQFEANPNDSGAAFGLAQRYLELGRGAEAASTLQAGAQANPNDVPLLHLLGDVQAQLGQADAAIAAWRQAATVQHTASNVNKLGQGLVQVGRYDEAEAVLNEALSLEAGFADPYFYLGELYRSRDGSGDRERAVEAYRRYLAEAAADAPWRALAEQHLRELAP